MSQEKLQTMVMQTFWGVIEVYYGIVQVVNTGFESMTSVTTGRGALPIESLELTRELGRLFTILVKTVGTIPAFPPHSNEHRLGGRAREKGNERRTRVAHITMEACTVNSLLFAQILASVPKSFDPDCRS